MPNYWPPIVSWYVCMTGSRRVDFALLCECCGVHPAVGVASSIGPISCAYCMCCLRMGYEPPYVMIATMEAVGGLDNLRAGIRQLIGELKRA